jgi:hypothetical protein
MNGVLSQTKIQILVIMAIGKHVFFSYLKKKTYCQVPVAHTCNPSYLGG